MRTQNNILISKNKEDFPFSTIPIYFVSRKDNQDEEEDTKECGSMMSKTRQIAAPVKFKTLAED